MRRFLKHIALYLLPIVFFAIVLEVIAELIPNSYTYKSDYMEQHKATIETLILGSSYAYDGINPYLLPQAFNLANSSQTLEDDYYLLAKHIDGMDSLKVLFIPISYSTFGEQTETHRRTYYTIYMNLYPRWPLSRYSFEVFDLQLLSKKIIKYIVSRDVTRCDSLGQRIGHTAEARDNGAEAWNKDIMQMVGKDSFIPKQIPTIVNKNYQYLCQIVRLCNEHNVKPIILNMPIMKEYKARLPKEQVELMTKILYDLKEEALCLDASELPINDGDWYNATHLTPDGAEVLTKKISTYVYK